MTQNMRRLVYDVGKLEALKGVFESNIDAIKEQYPINLNSRKQVTNYFKNTFDIHLKDVRIGTVQQQLMLLDMDSEAYCQLLGYSYYLKSYFTLKNYINYILRNNGTIVVENGIMPNHQPVSLAPEILECLVFG